MGRLDGKVAFITGAARGQGRAHAVRLAEEGADIVAVDIDGTIDTVPYPLAQEGDLAATAKEVEALGRRIIASPVDVRDQAALDAVVARAQDTFGHIDIVCANAAILSFGPTWELSEVQWQDVIDVNLTGAWHTVKAAIPSMIEAGCGGSIVLTSSAAALKASPNIAPYVASKHGVIGLMRTLALELAPHGIRVNTVNPTTVSTAMVLNDATYRQFLPDHEHPTVEDLIPILSERTALGIPWVEARDISEAVLWLASDEARYVTGVVLPISAGATEK
jgi:SDR family mycofactocin-dependent oxidoreductase